MPGHPQTQRSSAQPGPASALALVPYSAEPEELGKHSSSCSFWFPGKCSKKPEPFFIVGHTGGYGDLSNRRRDVDGTNVVATQVNMLEHSSQTARAISPIKQ